ncbi:MAG: hypothetical protein ACRC6E_02250, partial [Fusobacteriaceae bacterium]
MSYFRINIQELQEFRNKKEPNKMEQIENLVWTFFKAEAERLIFNLNKCMLEEDGVFAHWIKGTITS